MSTEAEINLSQKIPLTLSVVDKITLEPVPNATLSNVIWNQDNQIGEIVPDPQDPKIAIFTPSKAGVTHISATAVITIN
jgi:hypothetical protein